MIHMWCAAQMIVTRAGHLYTCGDDSRQQLGHGAPHKTGIAARSTAARVDALAHVKVIG